MSLTLEHNGYTLTFSEQNEDWSCHEMRLKAASLKALKAKLDKLDSHARRVAVPVIIVDSYGRFEQATITMIAKRKDWDTDYTSRERSPSVWVTKPVGNKTERSKVKLGACVLPSEENRLLVEAAMAKREQAKAMEREAARMLLAIPRVTLEDLVAKEVADDEVENVSG